MGCGTLLVGRDVGWRAYALLVAERESKGQLISKCPFSVFKSPKKTKTLDYCPAVENLQLDGATCCVCLFWVATTACSPTQLLVLYSGAVIQNLEKNTKFYQGCLTPYWSVLDVWKIKFNKLDTNFTQFQTGFLQATKAVKIKFEIDKKIRVLNLVFQKSSSDQQEVSL